MDQIRKVFGWLKRHHFWVLSVLVALLGIACWWSSTGTLRGEFDANQKSITAEITNVTAARNKPFLPNDIINQRQIEETNKQGTEVYKTWQQLYDRQREQVLEWPATLSPAFLKKIETLKFGDEITPQDLLENYQNYAERYFPELPKIVGARPLTEEEVGALGGGGGYGRGGSEGYARGGYDMRGEGMSQFGTQMEDDDDYICQWLDQIVIREKLNFPQRPSSWRVWVTQEDLWVYKALLNVIRNTNNAAGATRMSNAAVRVIQSLQVGQQAAPFSISSNRIYRVPMAAAAGDPSMLGMESGAMGAEGATGEGGYGAGAYDRSGGAGMEGAVSVPYGGRGGYGGAEGPMTPEMEMAQLLSYRYLDQAGKPMSVGGGMDPSMAADPTMATDTAAASGSPSDFGVEYKRLPVQMSLQMDRRWLTRLISECANQPLQIEVQQVRINPPDFGTGGSEGFAGLGGGGYGGYGRRGGEGYGGRGGGGGYESGGFGGAAANLFPDRTGIQSFSAQPNHVNVVVQGIIYIFNEPDPTKLKTADATEGALAAE